MIAALICSFMLAFRSAVPIQNPPPDTGDTFIATATCPVTAMSPEETLAVIEAAEAIDPVAGQEIRDAVLVQHRMKIAKHDQPGPLGMHDFNSMAVSTVYGVTVEAIALLHEWVHCGFATGPQSGGGTGGDDRAATDPCYPCKHTQMSADSWTLLSARICEMQGPPASPSETFEQLCKARKQIEQAARQSYAKCLQAPCTGYMLDAMANWAMVCPNCP